MSTGRRFLPPTPKLTRRTWEDVASGLEDFLRALADDSLGVPGGFLGTVPGDVEVGGESAGTLGSGWAPGDHSHSIVTDIVGGLGNTSIEGVSTALARADHVHKRDLNVKDAGVAVGTRNAINFTDTASITFTATDDSGNDEVDIAADLTTTWEDLWFPSQGINPSGSTAPPTVSTSTGMLEFSGTLDNVIAGVAQMPHAWVEESTIKPHIHLVVPASNAGKNSRWKFEYNRANIDGDFENAYGSYTTLATITIANPAATAKHLMVDFGDLTMAGFEHSALVMWRISRLAGSDVADDDSTTAWVLMEFDIHYQSNRRGTPTVP